MKTWLLLCLGLLLGSTRLKAQDDFSPGPDSLPQPGVPKGEMLKDSHTADEKSVFPGTGRDYQIYLPPGHDKTKPAPFMVFQDGVIYQAPVVFDNLIAKKDIPPLVGIFIKPGVVPAANDNALPRFNRSYEYDSVTDTYARFLIDEFLPALEKKHGLKLSADPNDAAIAGNSSGGMAAFMAAWHRPDRFRRVFTGVGTYVGIRGGDQLPVLVRKFEPKPIRVFLQSGENDNNLYCGDWWMANQMMERSLSWAGYDVNHAWGKGGHNAKHATQVFPDAMRWLWRDWQTSKEVKANPRGESKWRGYELIEPKQEWELVTAADSAGTRYLDSNKRGDVLTVRHSENGKYVWVCSSDGNHRQITCPPIQRFDQLLHASWTQTDKIALFVTGKSGTEMIIIDENGAELNRSRVSTSAMWRKPIMLFDGTLYWNDGRVSGMTASGRKLTPLANLAWQPDRWVVSPDQTTVYQCYDSGDLFCATVQSNGDWANFSRFGNVEPSSPSGFQTTSGICVDQDGWVYAATDAGIQVCDQMGRVNFIVQAMRWPDVRLLLGKRRSYGSSVVTDLCFGGRELSELFVLHGDAIYKRPTKAKGYISGQMAPIKPAPPKL